MSSKRPKTDAAPNQYPNQRLFLHWKQQHNIFKYSQAQIQIVEDGSLITKENIDSGKIIFDRPLLVTDKKEKLGIELNMNKVKKSNISVDKIIATAKKRQKKYTDSRKNTITSQSADSSNTRKDPARKKPKTDTDVTKKNPKKLQPLQPLYERTVKDCSTFVGKFVMQLVERMDKKLDLLYVINVAEHRDKKKPWNLYQLADYFETPVESRDFNLNQTSYEISQKRIAPILTPPTLVQEIDFATKFIPQEIKQHRKFTSVSKYIITSGEFAFMDFHIDFSGSSVWYTVIDGEKWWCLVKPTEEVLATFEKYYDDDREGKEFFVDRVAAVLGIDKNSPEIKDYILFIEQKKGQTIIIPAGWIHAVHTPVDTLAIGGNFVQGYGIKLQVQIHSQDNRMGTAPKFKYPNFELSHFYAACYYYEQMGAALQNLSQNSWAIPQSNISLQELRGLPYLISFLEKTISETGLETKNGRQQDPVIQDGIKNILEKTGKNNCQEFFDEYKARFAKYHDVLSNILKSLFPAETNSLLYDPLDKEPNVQKVTAVKKPCCENQSQNNIINLTDTSSESSQTGTTETPSPAHDNISHATSHISLQSTAEKISATKKQCCETESPNNNINCPSNRSLQTATTATPVVKNISAAKKQCCSETKSRNNNINCPSNRSLQAAEALFTLNQKDPESWRNNNIDTDQKKQISATAHKPWTALPDDIQSATYQHPVPQIVVAIGNPSLNYEHQQQEIISEMTSPGNNKAGRSKRMSEYCTMATDERKRTTKLKYCEYYDPSIVRLYGSKAIMLKELVLKQTFSKILGGVEAKRMTLCLPNKVCVVKVELDLTLVTQLEELNKKKVFVFDRKGIDLRHTLFLRQYDTINFNVLVSYNTFTDNKFCDTVFLTRGNVPSLLAWAPSIDLIKETISEEEIWIPYYDAMVQASQCKPNIARGADRTAISEIYMCFGQRRNWNDSGIGEYAFKPNTDEKVEQEIVSRVKALVKAIEKVTSHLFDNLSITGMYRNVVDKYKIQTMVKDGLTVAFCTGYNYASAIHKDKDAFYNTISCYNKNIKERETVVYNVCFPEYGFSVQLYNGSVLVYDPQFGHCVSNPVCAGTLIMSCFVSTRTIQAFISKGEADGFSFPINFSK